MFTETTNMPKVTIIMPAYNAEKFLEPTIESILNQTYPNIELYVVDDGSSDSTPDILRRLSDADKRLIVLSTDNSGPASARNYALDSLDGSSEYIMFCDADDFFEPDMIETVLSEAVDGADFVITGFKIINADGSESIYNEPDMRLESDNVGDVLGNLYKANLLNQVWGKLFRSDIIYEKNIRFPDYHWGEDRFFVFDYLSSSYTVSVLSYCGYKYVYHKGQSLITGFYKNKADICVLIDERIEELCAKFHVKDTGPFRYMFAKSIFSCLTNIYSPSCKLTHSEKRNYIWSIISNQHILDRCKGASGGKPIKILIWIMNSGSISLNMLAAKLSSFVSKVMPDTFRKLKHIK